MTHKRSATVVLDDGGVDLRWAYGSAQARFDADGTARLRADDAPALALGSAGRVRGAPVVQERPDGSVRVDQPLEGGAAAWWEASADEVRQGWTFQHIQPEGGLTVDVPVDDAVVVLDDVIAVGAPGHGWLGRELAAWDARGRALDIRAAATSTGFALHVDTAGATPPLMVDPVWEPWTWRAEGEQPGAGFAEVIRGVGDVNGDGYDDVVISTPRYSEVAGAEEGRAELFLGGATGLATAPARVWSTTTAGARFGAAVDGGDLNGDGFADVVVAAPGDGGVAAREGIVRVWWGGPAGPGASPDQVFAGGAADRELGEAVVVAGDLDGDGVADLVLGATGEVRVHLGGAAGLRNIPDQSILTSAIPAEAGDVDGDGRGDLLLRDSDFGLIAEVYDTGWFWGWTPETAPGQVRVLRGAPGGVDPAPWVTWTGVDDDRLGRGTAAADLDHDGFGDLVVGHSGGLWVYRGGTSPPADHAAAWTVSDPDYPGEPLALGDALAALGDLNGDGVDDVIVGAAGVSNGQILEGRASVYLGQAGEVTAHASYTVESDQDAAFFGRALGGVGDVNGDGYADFMVASVVTEEPNYFGVRDEDLGRAVLYFGGPAPQVVDTTLIEPPPGIATTGVFGEALAGLGDSDGDGFDDLLITDADRGGGGWWFPGGPAGPSTASATPLDLPPNFWQFGAAVAAAGDVNGDGLQDAIVGTAFSGQWGGGIAALYLGVRGSAPALAQVWEAAPPESDLGASVAGVGDLNADGYDDLAIGAPGDDWPLVSHVNVHLGGPGGASVAPDVVLSAAYTRWGLGGSVAGAGDVNGDGYDDLISSARSQYADGRDDIAWVYLGAAEGVVLEPLVLTTAPFYGLGSVRVTGAGDVDADAYDDVVVSVQFWPSNYKVYAHLGGPAGPSSQADRTLEGGALSGFGTAVRGVGDLNGDGYDDVVAVSADRPWAGGVADGARVLGLWGGPDGLPAEPSWGAPAWMVPSDEPYVVSGAGDVNGDGFDDLAVHIAAIPGSEGIPAVALLFGSPTGPLATPSGETVPRLARARTQRVSEGLLSAFVAEARYAGAESVRYTWDFGDGESGRGARVLHAWADDGVYDLRLTASVPGGFDHQDSKVVVENLPPVVLAAPDATGVISVPLQVALEVYDVDPVTVRWDVPQLGAAYGNPGTLTFNQIGTFTVPYTVSDDDGGVTSGAIAVEVGPPVFSLLPPTLVAGSTARVDARFADPGAQVAFFGSSLPGAGPTCAPAGAPCVELRQARWLGTDTADALGNARTRIPVPAGVAPGTRFWLQAVELGPQPQNSGVVAVTVAR